MGDLIERQSRVILSDEEKAIQLREAGKTDAEVDTEMFARDIARLKAQAEYDRVPPGYFKPVPKP